MKNHTIKTLLCFQHFLVDAVCLACVLGVIQEKLGRVSPYFLLLIALYNTMAFCTQWLTGLCCDLTGNKSYTHIIYAVFLTAGSVMCSFIPVLGVFLIGIGNSIFHVAGGKYILEHSGGKSASLGYFVAPGALGVYIGTCYGDSVWIFCLFVCLIALLLFLMQKNEDTENIDETKQNMDFSIMKAAGIFCILICIACRAASGSINMGGSSFPPYLVWLPVLAVFAGKFTGGFIGDRWGIGKVGTLAMLLGALLTVSGNSPALFLAGQFFMNILMALTLWQLLQMLPYAPGLVFGLAASVLYPGSLITLTGEPRIIFAILSAASVILFAVAQFIIIIEKKKRKQCT